MFTITFILLGLISQSICSDVDIVKRLKTRYNDTPLICVDSANSVRPAYECSGLLIRGVDFNKTEMKYPWSKKYTDKTDALSYAFLRTDQNFSWLGNGYGSGFIINPELKIASQANKLNVFCTFPINAITKYRAGAHGCGQSYKDTPGTSRECHTQGINSLPKWISHYVSVTNGDFFYFMRKQCGFDMTIGAPERVFQVVMAAKAYIEENYQKPFNTICNELRIEAWDDENCDEIPIETFFYFIHIPGAAIDAENNRDLFYKHCSRKVPIVGLRLPDVDQDFTIESAEY